MHCKSYSHFFSKKFQHICVSLDGNFNKSLTNDIVSFEQLGTFLPSMIKYCEEHLSYRVETKSNSNTRRGNNSKSKNVVILVCDMSDLVHNMLSHPVQHFYEVKFEKSKEYWSYRLDMKSNSNTRRGYNSKSKKARFVILICNTSTRPVLHFYQVSSKYSVGYSCYTANMKSNSNTRRQDNSKSKKANIVILVCDMSSNPVLHFYQVS